MKLKSILYLLIALPLLWSCNNEDNIEDIFSSGTWYLINFYGGGLDDAGTPEFTPKDDNATLEVIQKFTIVFNNDNTFKASAQNIDALVNARFYKGDSNYLRLAPEDKKSFIQLRHN